MADLEPWTYPMIQYYRGNVEPYRFFRKDQKREEVPVTKLQDFFPWAADKKKKTESKNQKTNDDKAKEISGPELTKRELSWTKDFEKSRTNYHVQYDGLQDLLNEGYEPQKVLSSAPDCTLQKTVGKPETPEVHIRSALDKAKKSLTLSRRTVQMYEKQLKATVPNSEQYNSARRAILQSALHANYRLCRFKAASNAPTGAIAETVQVIIEQGEELIRHLDNLCEKFPLCEAQHHLSAETVKDYAVALVARRNAMRKLLRIDGTEIGWQAVGKRAKSIADVATKADQAVLILLNRYKHEYNGTTETTNRTALAVPESLRVRTQQAEKAKEQEGTGAAGRQRSRIDDYFWQSIPEMHRKGMKEKAKLSSMTKTQREAHVLKEIVQYKATSRAGTHRMGKLDEARIHDAIMNIVQNSENRNKLD